MPSHIFTRLGFGMNALIQILLLPPLPSAMLKQRVLKGIGMRNFMAWTTLFMRTCKKEKMILQKNNGIILKQLMMFILSDFKVAYAFAAIPSRYLLENKMWNEAANLKIHPANFPWKNFPWQEAIIHFTRLLGSVHIGNIDSAKAELKKLNMIYDTLMKQKDSYKANQVQIQIKTSEAWIQFKEGKNNEALKLMNFAADMEDKTEKHPVTPGEVIPARELLGDMLLQMNKPERLWKLMRQT